MISPKNIRLVVLTFLLVINVYAHAEGDRHSKALSVVAPGSLVPLKVTDLSTIGKMLTMAINPVNQDVYIGSTQGDSQFNLYSTISIQRLNEKTGSLNQIGLVYQIQGLQWLTQIVAAPSGKYVYFYGRTGGGSGAAIAVYAVDSSGVLAFQSLNPVNVGDVFKGVFSTLTEIAISPDGKYLYSYYPVFNSANNSTGFQGGISAYSIDNNGGIKLTDTVAVPGKLGLNNGSPSIVHTFAVTNQYVYVQNMDRSAISTFSNNQGKLAQVNSNANTNIKARASAIVADPPGKIVYVAASLDNKIKIFICNVAQGGALEIVNIVDDINNGGALGDMKVDPSKRYLYLLHNDGIGMYRFGQLATTLVPLGMQSTYKNMSSESLGFVVMTPSGSQFLGLGDLGKDVFNIHVFRIAQRLIK